MTTLEELRWHKFPVLDDGFICLVDVMGDDSSVVQAARVSYGAGTKAVSDDRTLIRYLMRQHHSTPFEMAELKFLVRVPMDCWRQWIRHRTACLGGETPLVFSRPCDGRAYRMSVADVYEKFQPTSNTQRPDKQRNAYFRKDRIQDMLLRSVNEETGEVVHTRVVDVWQSGVKPLYRVEIETPHGTRSIRTSIDHLFLMGDRTWMKLSEMMNLHPDDRSVLSVSARKGVPEPKFNEIDLETEEWASIVGWEDFYEVSSQGRVRRTVGGRGSRSHGRCKNISVSHNRAVTSLNRPGKQTVILVHREMLRAFVGEPEPGQESLHGNGNSLDNRIENLRWGSSGENAEDMVSHGRSTFLCSQPCQVVSIEPDGVEMTYDVEVAGPWHNFSANDFIVHNSVNEYSTRYSEAIDSMQATAPDAWRLQSGGNKQGSSGYLPLHEGAVAGHYLTDEEQRFHRAARSLYRERIDAGVAREQARKDLPLSTYTEAYWKIDLHNLLHFLSLRMDSHAQQEIREYATIIGEQIVAPLFPAVWEAFQDYRQGGMFLSRLDVEMIRELAGILGRHGLRSENLSRPFLRSAWDAVTGNGNRRERDECLAKLERLGLMESEGSNGE